MMMQDTAAQQGGNEWWNSIALFISTIGDWCVSGWNWIVSIYTPWESWQLLALVLCAAMPWYVVFLRFLRMSPEEQPRFFGKVRSALKTVFVQVFSVSVYTAIVWAFGMESEWPFFFLGAGFMAFIIYRLCQVDGKTTEWRIAAVIVTSFLLSIAAPLKGKYDAGAEERELASKVEAERDFRRERVRAAFISNGNRPLDLGNGKKAYIVQELDYHWRPSGTEVNLWHTTADVRGVSDVWFFAYIDQVYVDMTAPGAGGQSNRYGGSNSGEYTLIWSEGSYTDDGVPRYVVVENLIKGVPALNTALGLDQLPVDAGSTLTGDAAQSNEK